MSGSTEDIHFSFHEYICSNTQMLVITKLWINSSLRFKTVMKSWQEFERNQPVVVRGSLCSDRAHCAYKCLQWGYQTFKKKVLLQGGDSRNVKYLY